MKELSLKLKQICPYCMIMGIPKKNDSYTHLDVGFSYNAGLMKPCNAGDILEKYLISVDDKQNPEFKEEIVKAYEELNLEFYCNNPKDLTKQTLSWEQFYIALVSLINYSDIMPEGKKLKEIKVADLKELYNKGEDLVSILKSNMVDEDI